PLLDQEPVLASAILLTRLHAHEHEVAIEPVAVQPEFEIALGQPPVRVADRLPGAAVPDHHRAAAIFTFGDDALELAVFERMVLGHPREALLRRVKARTSGDGPALQHAVMLKPEIKMGAPCRVLLDHEAVAHHSLALWRRFRGLAEVALGAVGRKRG